MEKPAFNDLLTRGVFTEALRESMEPVVVAVAKLMAEDQNMLFVMEGGRKNQGTLARNAYSSYVEPSVKRQYEVLYRDLYTLRKELTRYVTEILDKGEEFRPLTVAVRDARLQELIDMMSQEAAMKILVGRMCRMSGKGPNFPWPLQDGLPFHVVKIPGLNDEAIERIGDEFWRQREVNLRADASRMVSGLHEFEGRLVKPRGNGVYASGSSSVRGLSPWGPGIDPPVTSYSDKHLLRFDGRAPVQEEQVEALEQIAYSMLSHFHQFPVASGLTILRGDPGLGKTVSVDTLIQMMISQRPRVHEVVFTGDIISLVGWHQLVEYLTRTNVRITGHPRPLIIVHEIDRPIFRVGDCHYMGENVSNKVKSQVHENLANAKHAQAFIKRCIEEQGITVIGTSNCGEALKDSTRYIEMGGRPWWEVQLDSRL